MIRPNSEGGKRRLTAEKDDSDMVNIKVLYWFALNAWDE
jgi:hypothetical protein